MALASYYVIHEGAHLIYACSIGVFEKIQFMSLGMQILTDTEHMINAQLGIFCVLGVVATTVVGYISVFASTAICKTKSNLFKACMYYFTIAMLFIDPLYGKQAHFFPTIFILSYKTEKIFKK